MKGGVQAGVLGRREGSKEGHREERRERCREECREGRWGKLSQASQHSSHFEVYKICVCLRVASSSKIHIAHVV